MTRTVAAAASRKMDLFERKAGATIRVTRLGPSEGRIPLFDERGHALAHVTRAEKLMLDVGLELELRAQVAVQHLVQRALRSGVRTGRPAGQPLRQLERLLGERLGLDDL